MLIFLVICLIVFLVTYVVPAFAELYSSMQAQLPEMTQILIAVGTTARGLHLLLFGDAGRQPSSYSGCGRKTDGGRDALDRVKLRTPVLGEVWIKYQVAQFRACLITLLIGGIPLLQALADGFGIARHDAAETDAPTGSPMVKEGQSLSNSLSPKPTSFRACRST